MLPLLGMGVRAVSRPLPDHPRGLSALPEALERTDVPESVHALPEVLVLVRGELPVRGEPLECFDLEMTVAIPRRQVVEDRRLEDHETPVDPALADLGLFLELGHEVAVEVEATEPRGRPDRGHGREPSMAAVEGQEIPEVDVAHAVPVGQHEGLVLQPGLEPLQAAPGQGLGAGVHQVDDPVLDLLVVALDVPGGEVHGEATAEERVVEEEPLDELALVAQGAHELREAVVGVVFHDVPEDRLSTDLYHWLGTQRRLLREPRPEPTRQHDDLHRRCSSWTAAIVGESRPGSSNDGAMEN